MMFIDIKGANPDRGLRREVWIQLSSEDFRSGDGVCGHLQDIFTACETL